MKSKRQLKIIKIFTCLLIFSSLQSFALDKIDINNGTGSKLKKISVDRPMDQVSGRVTDNSGNPLSDASVIVKGTNKGVTTNSTGEFTLQVNKGQTLIITSVGYATQEISFNGQSFIEVKLTPSATSLSDVVVVAFGTQKKVDLTGAVSQVKGEDLVKRTTSNIQQALQGKIPGLTIQDYGASPGHTNMVMRIRGITSFGDNSPLVIVDGIEQTLDNINPQDISSVSVLKDAASTAIYGSRAANGVILITTKRAKSGKLTINYNGYYALQKSNNNPVHMGLRDYMDLQNIAWTNSYGNPIYTQEYIDEYVNATDRLKYPLPNIWYQTVLKVAPQISNYISLSGGNENVRTVLSARYQDQDGIIPNSNAKISEVRLNTDFKISNKITISTNINYRRSNILAPINEGKVFNDMLQTDQWTVPKYPDGTYGISSDGKNALMDAELNGTSKTLENYLTGNIEGNWEIIKGLKFTTQLGARTTATSGKNYQNKYEIRDYYDSTIVRLNVPHNSLTEIRNNVSEITLNSLLNYSNDWGGHNLNVLAGYSQIEDKTQTLTAYRQDFYSNEIQSIGQGANDATKNNSGGESTWGLRSYFGRINYNYENKYLFEANSRYDGSSRFMDKNRYSFFPSFSAGWRISQEKFWDKISNAVNELKLRGSWGQTGNQAVGLYSYLKSLNLVTYSFNGVPAPGYLQTTLANENLTWETTTQSDIGIDAEFLNRRISLTADYYYKKTEGILLSLPVPGTLGLLPSPQNAGRMDNRGWEFMLSSQNKFGEFGFNGSINFNINNNKIIDLAGTGPYITGGNETRYITKIGLPINSLWGYTTDGLFQTKEEIAKYPTMRSGIEPGDVKFVDLNNDGKITADDMTYLGRSFPKYTFGANLNLTYKGFSLSALFQGVSGVKARIGGAIIEMGIWGGFTSSLITNNYWTPDNPNARFPRPLKFDLRNIVMSDRDLQNGAYLRLKNINLAYQIPNTLTEKIGLDQVSVYVSTTNLLTFSSLNEWHVDPETIVGGRTQAYPQTSLTTFGLNIRL